ncbi:hypothetical protein [Sphingobacterium prati]|uniref:hypothetical protein n=1 Tax=Sphingobacterium prati TaxID=2737006 RepID=UPI001FED20A7|nr:hypothetical protein [Sphingobacterium prati]
MNIKGFYIAFLTISFWLTYSTQLVRAQKHVFDFYDGKVSVNVSPSFNIPFNDSLTGARLHEFYQTADQTGYRDLINSLLEYKDNSISTTGYIISSYVEQPNR